MGATYGVHVNINDHFPGLSLLELQGQIELGSFQRALRDLIRDIRTLDRTLSAAELDSVRRRMLGGYPYALLADNVLAGSMLWELRRGQPPEDAAQWWPKALKDADLAHCRAVAARWLTQANISLSVTGLPVKLLGKLAPGIRVRELYWTQQLSKPDKE
jgi:predicted Zn-dependent peptidase